MRIAMVSEHANPLAVLGGADAGGQNVHVRALSASSPRAGHDVTVYTPARHADGARAGSGARGVRRRARPGRARRATCRRTSCCSTCPPSPRYLETRWRERPGRRRARPLLDERGGEHPRGPPRRRAVRADLPRARHRQAAPAGRAATRARRSGSASSAGSAGRSTTSSPPARDEVERARRASACPPRPRDGRPVRRRHRRSSARMPRPPAPAARVCCRSVGSSSARASATSSRRWPPCPTSTSSSPAGRRRPPRHRPRGADGCGELARRLGVADRVQFLGGVGPRRGAASDERGRRRGGRAVVRAVRHRAGRGDGLRPAGRRLRRRRPARHRAARSSPASSSPPRRPDAHGPGAPPAARRPASAGGLRPRRTRPCRRPLPVGLRRRAHRGRLCRVIADTARGAVAQESTRRRHTPVRARPPQELPAAVEPVRRPASTWPTAGAGGSPTCSDAGGRLLAAGNGGSAAQAQHLTAELVGRYRLDRRPFSAICLSAETSTLTAIGNDYPPAELFARQVEAHGRARRRPRAAVDERTQSQRRGGRHAWPRRGLHRVGADRAAPRTRWPTSRTRRSRSSAEFTATVQELHLVALHVLCAGARPSSSASVPARTAEDVLPEDSA